MPHPIFPIVNILYQYAYLSQMMNWYWYSINNKIHALFRFLSNVLYSFLPNVLFLSQDPIQDTLHSDGMTLQAPLNCDSFSNFDCFLMILRVLRNTDQAFCRMSINLGLSGVFLMVIQELWAWGRETTEIKLYSHYITSRVHNFLTQLMTVSVGLELSQ